jgi:pyruvate dehydrogenase E1 component beta subunit
MHTPGLAVACPATPYDAKGMLIAAIRDDNPVIFLEHKLLYGAKGPRKEGAQISLGTEVPDGDYEIPLGTIVRRREGRDITILANMLMVHRALAAAEALAASGIDSEVIDVRCLVPLDVATVETSIRKTGRLLIVEEDHLTGGWGAEVAARIADAAFWYLRAPIRRVAGPDTPIPCAPALERAWVPDTDRIIAAAVDLIREIRPR